MDGSQESISTGTWEVSSLDESIQLSIEMSEDIHGVSVRSTSTEEPALPNSITTKELACFSKLPIELQVKIWIHAASPLRRDVQAILLPRTPARSTPYIKALTPVPAILHTCCNSRAAGLKVFKPVIKTRNKEGKFERIIYMDLRVDTLFVHFPTEAKAAFLHWRYGGTQMEVSGWRQRPGPFDMSVHRLTLLEFYSNIPVLPRERGLALVVQPDLIQGKGRGLNRLNINVDDVLERIGLQFDSIIPSPLEVEEWNELWEFLMESMERDVTALVSRALCLKVDIMPEFTTSELEAAIKKAERKDMGFKGFFSRLLSFLC